MLKDTLDAPVPDRTLQKVQCFLISIPIVIKRLTSYRQTPAIVHQSMLINMQGYKKRIYIADAGTIHTNESRR